MIQVFYRNLVKCHDDGFKEIGFWFRSKQDCSEDRWPDIEYAGYNTIWVKMIDNVWQTGPVTVCFTPYKKRK